MKNKIGLMCVLIGVFTFNAFGWYASSDTTGEHYELSTWLLTDTGFNYMPYFKPYAERLEELEFDINEIIEQADDEVYDGIGDHPHFGHIDNMHEIFTVFTFDEEGMGSLLHASQDCGVLAIHNPANLVWTGDNIQYEGAAHDALESTAHGSDLYYHGNPFLAYDKVVCGASFDEKLDSYKYDYYVPSGILYRDWYLAYGTPTVPTQYIDSSMLLSLRLSNLILPQFLDYHEVTEPGSTIARWSFTEYAGGEIGVNSKGSIPAQLQQGSSPTTNDAHEAEWAIGGAFGNGAIHCKGYTEASNNTTYFRDINNWKSEDGAFAIAEALMPDSSYTVEVVFQVEDYVVSTTDSNRYMGILAYRDYDGANPNIEEYVIRTYKQLMGDYYIPFIEFTSDDSSGNAHTVSMNTSAQGMAIQTGRWYYLAAVFHYPTNSLDLILRDMTTGQTISQSGGMYPMKGLGTLAPNPVFLIGTENSSTGKNFDGLIDEVRISNRALNLDSDRLWTSTVGHWKFDTDNVSSSYQTFYNTEGIGPDLQNGSSSGTDSRDLYWNSSHGFWGSGDVKGKCYSETTAYTVKYAKSTTMDATQREALRMQDSYSIEAVFCPETLPTTGGTNNTYMGIVSYADTTPSPDTIFYKLGIYQSGSSTYVYYSAATSPASSAISWCTSSGNSIGNITITAGKWYYIGAFYDASTNIIKFHLRDLSLFTGTYMTESGNYTMNHPVVSFSASPAPLLLVGAETTGVKGFDGWIDEVRISNSLLAPKDRLYMNNSTVAQWSFNYDYATAGQVIDNVDNDYLLNLCLGSTFNINTNDPLIEPHNGYFDGALRNQSYSQNGNTTKYARMPAGWAGESPNVLIMTGAYSIETVFKVDEHHPTSSDNDQLLGIITYRDDATGLIQYRLRVYEETDGHTHVAYYSHYNSSSGRNINWDTTGSGIDIVEGQWYYIGAFFNGTNKMDLHLRNLETNENATYSNQTMYPMAGLSVTPDPVFIIGANTLTEGQCFDGWIDEIKISNKYLTDDCRLYNYPQ